MAVNKLIPDDLKLEGISKEAAICLAASPDAIMDYINHLVEAYNERVDDVNEYYKLWCKNECELVDYKVEHGIMARIINDNGLWDTMRNDDEFLDYLCRDEDDILGLKGDNDAIDNEE